MKLKINIMSNKLVFFKRWQNKGFSILNSLSKIIIILVLPFIYLTLSFSYSFSQTDTIDLNKIIIESKRKPISESSIVNVINLNNKHLTSNNLSDVLDGTLGVDFLQRGFSDIQSDISIRGGNFDQNLILLNGIPISDPQTGHNSFSIPISFDIISQVQIHQGASTNIYGIGAYSGAINIITKKHINQGYISASYGQFNTQNYSATYLHSKNKFFGAISSTYKKSDGYAENTDYEAANLFVNENYNSKNFKLSLQTSLSYKTYGALNFYTPNFPHQSEDIGKINSGLNLELGNNLQHQISVFYNLHLDQFELFREDEDWFVQTGGYWIKNNTDTAKYAQNVYQSWAYYPGHNYHKTQTVGISVGSNFSTILGKTYYGLFIQNDNIKSSTLGLVLDSNLVKPNSPFTKGDNRLIYNAYLEQFKKLGKFEILAGANAIYNEVFGFFQSFSGSLAFIFSDKTSGYLSANQGVRLPTFTDLYYSGPSNEGNIDLKPEKATTYELGFKFKQTGFTVQSAIFYRMAKNSIDWVKFNENDEWKTMNYAELNTAGFQFLLNKDFQINLIKNLTLNYTYLQQEKPQTDVISKYSLNYLKHNLSISANHDIFKNLNFSWTAKYSIRNGSYFYIDNETNTFTETEFSPFLLIDAKISYVIFEHFTLYVQASNLLDTDYYDLSYIKLPGRWIGGGVRFELY